jgi:hypothetical protein
VSLLSPFSSLVMQTPIFLTKLSDESIIFISDVGKNLLTVVGSFLLYGSFQLSSSVLFRALLYSISKIPSISQNTVAISLPFLAVDPLHGFLFCRWIPVIDPRFITCYNFLKKLFVVRQSSQIFFANVLQTQFLFGIKQFRNPTCAEILFIPKSSCNIFKTVASNITTSSAVSETLIFRLRPKPQLSCMFSLVLGFIFFPSQEFDYASMLYS